MPLSPLSAKVEVGPGDRLSAYVEARTADAVGDQLRAARLFATLASAEPTNTAMARRAVAAAINAGDTALALSVARSVPAEAIGLDGRLLLVADALRRDKAGEALPLVEGKVDDNEGGFVAPLIRDGELLGVLDIDSPKHARFDEEDEAGCVRLGEILARAI